MSSLKGNICVFTGSRQGRRADYVAAARRIGRELVERGYGLVYGGGNVGLMTVVADTVLECHGHVTGVIPERLVEKSSTEDSRSGSCSRCTSGKPRWPSCPAALSLCRAGLEQWRSF